MEKEQKIYVGSGKKAQNYDIVNITVCLDDKIREHAYEYNGKKYINLTVAAKREPDQWDKTHSVSINTYKPEKKEITDTIVDEDDGTNLPF